MSSAASTVDLKALAIAFLNFVMLAYSCLSESVALVITGHTGAHDVRWGAVLLAARGAK